MEKGTRVRTFIVSSVYEAYLLSAAIRAVNIVGRCMNIKGVIFEIILKDKLFVTNIANGMRPVLTTSRTAQVVDIMLKQGKKIMSRIQAKDTPSISGMRQVLSACKSLKYRTTKIYVTKETAGPLNRLLEKSSLRKRVINSGIPSSETNRSSWMIGITRNGKYLDCIRSAAKVSGWIGAIIGAGEAAIRGAHDVYNGRRSISDVMFSVAHDGAKGWTVFAGAAAVAAAVDLAIATTVAAPVAALIVSIGVSYVVGNAISEGWDWIGKRFAKL